MASPKPSLLTVMRKRSDKKLSKQNKENGAFQRQDIMEEIIMSKIKKLVAAAIAVTSVSAMSVSAFASVNWGDIFALKFKASEDNVFTDSATKVDSFADDAAVTVHKGANPYRPVLFSVWNSNDELYGNRLTKIVPVNDNYATEYMPYDSGAESLSNDLFFMNAFSGYDMDIEGLWAP